MTGRDTWLAGGLLGLAAGLVVTAVVGPAGLALVRSHGSPAVEAQTVAVDLVGVLLVAPLMVLLAQAAWHGRARVARLAIAPAACTAYLAAQRLVPLQLLLVVGGVLVGVRAWGAGSTEPAGRWSDRRTTAGVAALLALGAVALLGRGPAPRLAAGLVAPAVLVTAVGLRRGSTWARNLFPAITLWFALVGVSVLALSVAMLVRDVAGASVSGTVVLGVAAVAFVTLAARTLHGLRPESPVGLPRWGDQEVTHALRQEARARHPSGRPSGPP